MATQIPDIAGIRAQLNDLTMDDLKDLASKSGVGFSTLLKIKLYRDGDKDSGIENPGIQTVRKFYPLLQRRAAQRQSAKQKR